MINEQLISEIQENKFINRLHSILLILAMLAILGVVGLMTFGFAGFCDFCCFCFVELFAWPRSDDGLDHENVQGVRDSPSAGS